MKGRTVLVTGTIDGIGKATALGLAEMGARVILHGRDPEKGRRVLEEIAQTIGSDQLDIFMAEQVRKLATEVLERHQRLHVLINNAGTFQVEHRWTEDKLETTFAVNNLAPFLLTHQLLKLLMDSKPSRIVNVASIATDLRALIEAIYKVRGITTAMMLFGGRSTCRIQASKR